MINIINKVMIYKAKKLDEHNMYEEVKFSGDLVIGNNWDVADEFGNDTLAILNRKKKQFMIIKYNDRIILKLF